MDGKKILLGLIPLLVLAVLIVVLAEFGAVADETGTRSPSSYVGSDQCQSCHSTQHAGWQQTYHPDAWDKLVLDPGKTEGCEPCHVTGSEDVAHGGFDSATDLPVIMRGIQCEACHGPGSDHVNTSDPADIFMDYSAEVCGAACHQEKHHPYYEEWNQSGHSMALISLRGATGAAEDSCLGCHSADYILEDPANKSTLATAEYAITCSVCHDPHDAANPNQLRQPVDQLCASCHNPSGAHPGDPIYHPQSSMRDGRSGAPILGEPFMPDVECSDCHVYMNKLTNVTGHSFRQKPQACVECHATVPPILSNETAQTLIAQWRTETWTRAIEVQHIVALAGEAIRDAPDYGFSQSTIDIAADLYDEANYSLAFVVADGSAGAHNPVFASDLLNFSEQRGNELIALLTPGTIRGRVVDTIGNPVQGVAIEKDGITWATSSGDGTFEFDFAPGTHSFDLKLRGSRVGSISAVTVVSQSVTDVGDVEIVEENVLIPMIIAVGAIILLSMIVIYLLFKKKGTGPKEDTEA